MKRQALIESIRAKQSFLCVGLDTDPAKLPSHLVEEAAGNLVKATLAFNKGIIEATHHYTIAYKVNTAFYEAMGAAGWQILHDTVKMIPKECLSILDAKRGDIGNTSDQYAKAFFAEMEADAVTVTPYMGSDSIKPFLNYRDKWTIALALTSNTGSHDLQQLAMADGRLLYEVVISQLCAWGSPGQLMLVAGATRGAELAKVRALAPDYFLLVPGVGAQGGRLDDVCKAALTADCCLIVNSTRQIIYASSGIDYDTAAATEAAKLQQQMAVCLTEVGFFSPAPSEIAYQDLTS